MRYPNLLVTVHPLKGQVEKWACNIAKVQEGVLRLSRAVECWDGTHDFEHVASFPLTSIYRWHEERQR